jgi:hypothetical protein
MMNSLAMRPPSEMDEILQLIKAFEALTAQSANFMEKTAIDLEKQKLKIIQDFEEILNRIIPPKDALPVNQENSLFSLSQTSREMLYYFVLIFGMFESIAGSYLFGSTLFSLIPGISDTVHLIASIVFTALDSILFYAFEVTLLKDSLGIPYDDTDFTQSIETYSSQLNTTITINKLLATIYMLDVDNVLYDQYINLTTLLNADLRIKEGEMQPYPESTLTNILKMVVLVYGAVSNAAGSYFFSNELLKVVAASMVGTPLGYTLVALTMLCGLSFYYAMGCTSMINLITPSFDEYQALKAGLTLFKTNYHDDLSHVRSIRERFTQNKPINSDQNQPLRFFKLTSANEEASSNHLRLEDYRTVFEKRTSANA